VEIHFRPERQVSTNASGGRAPLCGQSYEETVVGIPIAFSYQFKVESAGLARDSVQIGQFRRKVGLHFAT
jgi:hypothetical protein